MMYVYIFFQFLLKCLVHGKSQFREKMRYFPLRNFRLYATMLQHLIIQFLLNYLSSGRLREVKNIRKFQTFSSKSGRGRLREAVAYKRFQMQLFDLEIFGIFDNWWLRRGGRLREVVTTGGSTVGTKEY